MPVVVSAGKVANSSGTVLQPVCNNEGIIWDPTFRGAGE